MIDIIPPRMSLGVGDPVYIAYTAGRGRTQVGRIVAIEDRGVGQEGLVVRMDHDGSEVRLQHRAVFA